MLETVDNKIFAITFDLKRLFCGLFIAASISRKVAGRTPVCGVIEVLKIVLRDRPCFTERVF